MNSKRKLAAIVFADIAGYTNTTNRDEGSALNSRGRVERLIKSCTVSHNGRIVKTMGDGAMLEFASAVDAVGAALDIQDQMDHLNAELELPEPVQVRVGVHVGEVVEEDNDLFGNAVNIASRVHNMASPGGICITREVYVQIRPILKLRCDPVGGGASDRLPEPIEVFQIMGGEDPASPARSRRRNERVFAAVLATVAISALAISGYVVFGGNLSPKEPEVVGKVAHRLLLPDWVSPGDEFELDPGGRNAKLVVFCGNKRAQTREVRGKLMVRVPADLPTQSTTISVFEDGASTPLLSQTTQVIRSQIVAMNTPSQQPDAGQLATQREALQKGPAVEITSQKPSGETNSGQKEVQRTAVGKPTPTNPKSSVLSPGAGVPASPGPNFKMSMGPMPPNIPIAEYDELVGAVETGDFEDVGKDLKDMKLPSPNFQKAMRAVSLASMGKEEEARKLTVEVRTSMKGSNDPQAAEIESLVKSADAIITDPKARGMIIHRPKWAEAFAFSINNGTKNFAGLAMIAKLLESGDIEEAKRALELIKKQPNLTPGEKKLIARFERRVAEAPKQTTPPTPPDDGN